jgi:hypothetical protein
MHGTDAKERKFAEYAPVEPRPLDVATRHSSDALGLTLSPTLVHR